MTEQIVTAEQFSPRTFKDAALQNRGYTDLWTPLVRSLPQQDRKDPIPAIIQRQAEQLGMDLDRKKLKNLAKDYDKAWRESGLPAGDRRFDHQAQVTWFLTHQPQTKTTGLSRRRFLGLAAATTAGLTVGNGIVGGLLIREAGKRVLAENPQPADMIEALLKPFAQEAKKKRLARHAQNPQEYEHRIDNELNQDRINFLLYGYGEEYNGDPTQATFGSHSILSIDLKRKIINAISLTHDIRAREIERFLYGNRTPPKPIRIDKAFDVGGFELMRDTLENATGLNVDYQIVFEDTLIKDAVNDLFGQLTVNVPFDVDTQSFRDEGRIYPEKHFLKGVQKMNGQTALQFIKAWSNPPEPSKERNVRKHIIMQTLFKEAQSRFDDPAFSSRAAKFLRGQLENKQLLFDFPLGSFLPYLWPIINSFVARLIRGNKTPSDFNLGQTTFVVDPAIGNGGVQWVTANAHENPITAREIENGIYQGPDGLAMEIPFNADPYAADLVTGYWKSVRDLVKQRLTSFAP